ncbi:imelysin family protein [Photobacterium sp. TY1-4]|uniref:imelysin family protein n=1 Tax=Photobacterium sp. TY1-4 TaxID=2899122 RepID=UPI0021BF7DEB|nr:imelysin family protein [Photobacterium sp. TY1-4]UXI02325.1 imelysin family protein [Photobacterium sp. TY1-4]
MKSSVLSVAAAALLMTGCQEQQTMSEAVHQLHVTSAEDFTKAAGQLNQDLEAVCESYSPASLAAAQQSWRQAMDRWMVFQGRDKGSEAALALSWQIQFWPDKKNITGVKLSQMLKQDKAWTVADVAGQSVAVQGLGATEWFLYEHADQLANGQGCALAGAIGGRLQQSSEQLLAAWQNNPWQQMTPQMALGEYLGALNNQLDYSMKKLGRPLGKPGSPKPYQAEAWRSQTSLSHLKASVAAMQQLYLAGGHGIDALLREQGFGETADRINNQFASLLADWPQSDAMVPMLKTVAGYRELLKIYNGLEYIRIALHDEVAPELKVVVGFNATDGD